MKKTISCMNIDENILRSFGGESIRYKAKEFIFREGEHSLYYFQVISGKVKLNTFNDDGKEFIQNILGKNQSFGDPLLFIDRLYPTNAVSLEAVEIIRMPKPNFIDMLQKHPDLSLEMNACLSQRLYYNSLMVRNMASQNPIHRLQGLMEYLKSYYDGDCQHCFPVELTRQQIADLTGLRVETVIRIVKKMVNEEIIKLDGRRILY
ncbi:MULTISPECIES: Crp/Fnr family transcriptional regulator [Chryseobacterium]|uniref:Crp/Fnr family transcriptional regulator n=1 Tax=Chryseobacterium TaxID=59732 RepID=UPI0009D8F409|nr:MULTISPECIES: Crp/Fnr family transcriptional regulator [Chryseobacterium]MDR6547366.1 CRP-like cAMP-binding protein [Chryseobacterium rhizosphaerae]SMC99430.1 cAMP-binding domain of CRP or a regulatory subunit of cAMP-dependent protein kinases [Chryseobacterium sp. YR221]